MKVRLYAQREFGVEELGAIVLKGDQLVAEPETTALVNLLSEPLVVYQGAEHVEIDPKKEPQGFLSALPRAVRGSYFWAGQLEE